ncbi:D-alanine--D-alanine ligase [uncultured Tenacibaculum sp.]|uniref:D-alanine--D-alanine ligase n=1 Tax=uncultured Tenacibaculum sp. TaxID=174713 RepID=UPI0026127A69|nr:D-alanine--D-alanine ligase [uncultured Tenacibaculum sp.]
MKSNIKLTKLLNWEHWPSYMFYIPNIPFAFYHGVKAGSLVFYTATNPGIENSGIGTESKHKTLQLLPQEYLPKTIFHKANSNIEDTLKAVNNNKITYPLIAKPDIGFRGLLVKKIENKDNLISYLEKYPIDILIQEFLTEENECGIFYHRLPNEKKGKITSITLKEFLHVIGDGTSTIEELIKKDNRAKIYLELVKENSKNIDLQKIISKGKKIKLSSIGNHSKGTRFINGNHLISEKLEATFNKLNNQSNDWFYGRLDLKYNSFSDVENGDFKILELNGILAEPTHIYDSENINYFQALKEIRKHWTQLNKIARYNHDQKNVPYRTTIGLLKDVKKLVNYTKYIAKLNKS